MDHASICMIAKRGSGKSWVCRAIIQHLSHIPGGIIIAPEALDKFRIATTCGYVLKMGDLAYADKDKFNKPWCKVGDWVMFARYAGARLPIEGGEVRILNDDEVLGTIKDPESVLHYI